jgi:uncharacterized protein YvpB
MKRIIVLGTMLIALAGCGSSGRSQAQIRGCWNRQVAQFVRQYNQQVGAGVGGEIIPDIAAVYEKGATVYKQFVSGGLTSPAITTRMKTIQRACGRLNS